jgi:hypothetical protein
MRRVLIGAALLAPLALVVEPDAEAHPPARSCAPVRVVQRVQQVQQVRQVVQQQVVRQQVIQQVDVVPAVRLLVDVPSYSFQFAAEDRAQELRTIQEEVRRLRVEIEERSRREVPPPPPPREAPPPYVPPPPREAPPPPHYPPPESRETERRRLEAELERLLRRADDIERQLKAAPCPDCPPERRPPRRAAPPAYPPPMPRAAYRCTSCHDEGVSARRGGGLTLFAGGSPVDLAERTRQRMAAEVRAGTMPPTGTRLSTAERNELLAWLGR